jgi:hypothetical protein
MIHGKMIYSRAPMFANLDIRNSVLSLPLILIKLFRNSVAGSDKPRLVSLPPHPHSPTTAQIAFIQVPTAFKLGCLLSYFIKYTLYGVFALLKFYAAQVGSWLPTFRDNLWVPTSRVIQSRHSSLLI